MFRISKLTDYSTVIMHELALAPEKTLSAKDIAERCHLQLPTVSKILKILTEAGLVTSLRGASGGYSLARSPQEINVAQIIRAMEGYVALTECAAQPGKCQQEACCAIRSNWKLISNSILKILSTISLSDMTQSLNTHPLFENNMAWLAEVTHHE